MLTEDWGGRGVAELWFVSDCCFVARLSPPRKVWQLREKFPLGLDNTCYLRSRSCFNLYTHRLITAIIQSVFFYCSARLSELKSTLNADWFAVSDCTAESAVATWFYIQGKTEVAWFLPFSTDAMELTYWSFVLLGFILLDWALLTSAEEGKSGVFPSNAAQTCFLWLHGWVRRPITIMSSSFQEEVQCNHKII